MYVWVSLIGDDETWGEGYAAGAFSRKPWKVEGLQKKIFFFFFTFILQSRAFCFLLHILIITQKLLIIEMLFYLLSCSYKSLFCSWNLWNLVCKITSLHISVSLLNLYGLFQPSSSSVLAIFPHFMLKRNTWKNTFTCSSPWFVCPAFSCTIQEVFLPNPTQLQASPCFYTPFFPAPRPSFHTAQPLAETQPPPPPPPPRLSLNSYQPGRTAEDRQEEKTKRESSVRLSEITAQLWPYSSGGCVQQDREWGTLATSRDAAADGRFETCLSF